MKDPHVIVHAVYYMKRHVMNALMDFPIHIDIISMGLPGHVAQSVTCLTSDMCLNADPGVANSIPARSHTFADHEIISTTILLPSADSRRVVARYKRKYAHEELVNCLVKFAQEKKSVVRLTDRPDMTIAVDWDVKNQTIQTKV